MTNGKPKPVFYLAVAAIVIALVGFAVWRFSGGSDGTSGDKKGQEIDLGELDKVKGKDKQLAEDPNSAGITTVKEYAFVASERLPDVKGVSGYKKMSNDTVRFAINVWAGWAPIVFANEGFKPKKIWKTPDGKEFKVELVLIDEPITMRDAFASGDIHIGWGTVDMLPLFLEALQKDSRVMPRVYQQIDWSNGGDGIVVREDIKTMSDLKGKSVVLAQNSPSHYFILNALLSAGVQPADVDFKFTKDAFQAAAAFNADKSLAGVVSWAPDIYKLSEVPGNKLLVSTQTANKLIADVWFARADFAKDNPAIVEGLVRGIFDAMTALEDDANKDKVAGWMSAGYSIPKDEARAMLGDAHATNFAENREFFINQNNPTNFETTFATARFLYGKIGAASNEVTFDQVADFSILQKLAKEPKYSAQTSKYEIRFTPMAASVIQAESEEILTKTVVIHFFPNSWDLDHKVVRNVDGKDKEVLYDPNIDAVIKEIGQLAGQYGASRIVIEGHTDGSMKGTIPEDLVKDLANRRAASVKERLVQKFPSLQPNQFATNGVGWARPADANDPQNHAKNRRVEVKVYPLEAQPPQ